MKNQIKENDLGGGRSLVRDKDHDLNEKKLGFWTFSSSNEPKYKTPEEMQEKIIEYFTTGRRTKQVFDSVHHIYREIPIVTVTGLTLYLGFADRKSFYNYEKKDAFSHTIKRARTFMEMEYEEMLSTGNHTSAIFALKNFGWKDTQTIEGEMTNHNVNKTAVVNLNELLNASNNGK